MKRPQLIATAGLICLLTSLTAGAAERYAPNWESLDTRPCPPWFQDAKFGIFIHWGVYSVPAWSPKRTYAEWYWNSLTRTKQGETPHHDPKGETWRYHVKNYGEDFEYPDFVRSFKAQSFDPDHWAKVFARSGARYVVLTSKHHDGFCLFKSEHANRSWGRAWNSVDAGPRRDLLGDLGESVRKQGLKMGFYYSMYEWYNPLWLTDRAVFVEKHMLPQLKDLVTRYKPSIIFSDGEWDMPSHEWKSEEFLAWLYNESPVLEDVIVNDRWGEKTRHLHGTYYTTEYTSGFKDTDHPWEESRGMGHSYGYNRNESLADYKPARELLLMLIDLVSRGGNLLLDIGPTADGRIPVIMEERLLEIGAWLEAHGEAIYGTNPWRVNRQWSPGEKPTVEYGGVYKVKYAIADVTGDREPPKAVIEAFFTAKGDTLYAITPRWPGRQFVVQDVTPSEHTVVTLVPREQPLKWKRDGSGIVIELPPLSPADADPQQTYALKLTNVR